MARRKTTTTENRCENNFSENVNIPESLIIPVKGACRLFKSVSQSQDGLTGHAQSSPFQNFFFSFLFFFFFVEKNKNKNKQTKTPDNPRFKGASDFSLLWFDMFTATT